MRQHLASVVRFLYSTAAQRPVQTAIRSLRADDIERFFVDYCMGRGPGVRRQMQSTLRHFLRFSEQTEGLNPRLVAAVPPLRTYRLSTVPKGLRRRW